MQGRIQGPRQPRSRGRRVVRIGRSPFGSTRRAERRFRRLLVVASIRVPRLRYGPSSPSPIGNTCRMTSPDPAHHAVSVPGRSASRAGAPATAGPCSHSGSSRRSASSLPAWRPAGPTRPRPSRTTSARSTRPARPTSSTTPPTPDDGRGGVGRSSCSSSRIPTGTVDDPAFAAAIADIVARMARAQGDRRRRQRTRVRADRRPDRRARRGRPRVAGSNDGPDRRPRPGRRRGADRAARAGAGHR